MASGGMLPPDPGGLGGMMGGGMMPPPRPEGPLPLNPGDPIDPMAPPPPEGKVLNRDPPEPTIQRGALVRQWQDRVIRARDYWEKVAFQQMRKDMRMARGDQWGDAANRYNAMPPVDIFSDDPGDRYVANVVLRHVQQRTATIYGKNPTFVARRNKRLNSVIWDGTLDQLTAAQQTMASAQQAMSGMPSVDPATGMPMPPPPPPPPEQMMVAEAVMQEAQQVQEQDKQLNKIAETLELLFEHEINEQPVPFKVNMKATVRRALIASVGYVKLGYSRVMGLRPELEAEVSDMSDRLAAIERLAADLADGEDTQDSPEAEQLRLAIQGLQTDNEVVLREGLTFTYPFSTAIIPSMSVTQLRGFVGADWVAEEFLLTADRIKEVYHIDIRQGSSGGTTSVRPGIDFGTSGARAYIEQPWQRARRGDATGDNSDENTRYCVWEIYNKTDGLVYVVCDGYADFLGEPGPPDVWLERFWPWFPFTTNELYDENSIYPPSDVTLIRDMQLEINRARQGLREHRRAARPKTVGRQGMLEPADKEKLTGAKANEYVELAGLPDTMKVEDALVAWSGPQINPVLYETEGTYQDILRVVGMQEANLGGTSGATATESQIAEGSRVSSTTSTIDDLDEMLTELARSAGQVLFNEMLPETVKAIVGPGAIWPELSKVEISREIFLDIEAASSGRPNQAQQIQNATQIFPLLMQIPGLSPEWMAREMLRRLDDKMDLSDAFTPGLPSIQSLNGAGQVSTMGGGSDPQAQGAQGGQNAPGTEPPRANVAPNTPAAAPPPAGLPN